MVSLFKAKLETYLVWFLNWISRPERTVPALDALDQMADEWADEVRLDEIVRAINGDPEKVDIMLRESFVEGLYRGRTSR